MTVMTILALIILLFGFVVFRGAPYVPSLHRYAEAALDDLYPVGKKDVLVDVGSGDGVILRMAAKRGARAVGYELNPILVLVSRILAKKHPHIQTNLADFWLVDLPDETTIVYAFSVTRDMKKMATKLQQTADRVEHPVWLMTYGASMPFKTPEKKLQAHTLYLFEPKH